MADFASPSLPAADERDLRWLNEADENRWLDPPPTPAAADVDPYAWLEMNSGAWLDPPSPPQLAPAAEPAAAPAERLPERQGSFGAPRTGKRDEAEADALRKGYMENVTLLTNMMADVSRHLPGMYHRVDKAVDKQRMNKICLRIDAILDKAFKADWRLVRQLKDARACSKSPYAIQELRSLATFKTEFNQKLFQWAKQVNEAADNVKGWCEVRPIVPTVKIPPTVVQRRKAFKMAKVPEETSGDIRQMGGANGEAVDDDEPEIGVDELTGQAVQELLDHEVDESDDESDDGSDDESDDGSDDESDDETAGGQFDARASTLTGGAEPGYTRYCRRGEDIMTDVVSGAMDMDSMEAQVFFASLAVKGRKRWDVEANAPPGSGYLYFDPNTKDSDKPVLKRATHATKQKSGTHVRSKAGPRVFMMAFTRKFGLDLDRQEQVIVYSVRGSTSLGDWLTDAISSPRWREWAERRSIIKKQPALLTSSVADDKVQNVHSGIFAFGVHVGHIILSHLALGHCRAANRVLITGCSLGGASTLIAGHMVYHHVTQFATLQDAESAETALLRTVSDQAVVDSANFGIPQEGAVTDAEAPAQVAIDNAMSMSLKMSLKNQTQTFEVAPHAPFDNIQIESLDVRSYSAPGYIKNASPALSMTQAMIDKANAAGGIELRMSNRCNLGDGVIHCNMMLKHGLNYPVGYMVTDPPDARLCETHGISTIVNTDPCNVLGNTRKLRKYLRNGPASFLHNMVTDITPDGPVFWASSKSKAKKNDGMSRRLLATEECRRAVLRNSNIAAVDRSNEHQPASAMLPRRQNPGAWAGIDSQADVVDPDEQLSDWDSLGSQGSVVADWDSLGSQGSVPASNDPEWRNNPVAEGGGSRSDVTAAHVALAGVVLAASIFASIFP